MTILWSILSSIVTSFITVLVFNFFLHRMTENAAKPWMTKHHQEMLVHLSIPNALATVQLPNGSDKIYEVAIPPGFRFSGRENEYLEAFDEMVEHKIVVPVSDRQQYRLYQNYKGKYRKTFLTLVCEEFGIKSIFSWPQKLFLHRKRGSPVSIQA
jgi:hypothetical protein